MLFRDESVSCAHCVDDYLHHVAIDIHIRVKEGGETVSTRVFGGDLPSTANPSSRHSGAVMLLWCEHCHGITELMIAQDRGQTRLSTKAVDKESGHAH